MADDEIYWRIIIGKDDMLLRAVQLQWFDEHDYDQSRFVDKERYATEEAANARIHVLDTHLGRVKAV